MEVVQANNVVSKEEREEETEKKLLYLPISKLKRTPLTNVRNFWLKYLKPHLMKNPTIKKSSTFRELAKLKDVSIKRLMNLIYEEKEDFEIVQCIYKEILTIFKRFPTIEKEYPKYVDKLSCWFERVLIFKDFDELTGCMKIEEPSTCPDSSLKQISNPLLPLKIVHKSKKVSVPVEFLFGLQTQISGLMIQVQTLLSMNSVNA
jgi:hypothetical protein